MAVRLQRLAYFQGWLRRYFGVVLTLDEKGIRRLNRWGNKYAGLLLVVGADGHANGSYFRYNPPWTGENATYNVLFDMGIALGEALIANCPKLHWDVDPVSAVLPRTAKILKRYSGMSFQRPQLACSDNPGWSHPSLNVVELFAHQMMVTFTTFKGMLRHLSKPAGFRRDAREELLNGYRAHLTSHSKPDPLRGQMSEADYLEFIDREAEEEERSG